MLTTVSIELIAWARWTLAGVMAVACLGKLIDLDSFIQAVINYHVLPRRIVRIFARLVPWLELGAALLLLIDQWVVIGALLSGLLLISFSAAATLNIVRGRHVSCGCMGKLTTERLGGPLLFRNTLLMALVLLLGFSDGVQAHLSTADWFPLSTLVVSSVIVLTLFGSGLDFLRQAFFPDSESGEASLKKG